MTDNIATIAELDEVFRAALGGGVLHCPNLIRHLSPGLRKASAPATPLRFAVPQSAMPL